MQISNSISTDNYKFPTEKKFCSRIFHKINGFSPKFSIFRPKCSNGKKIFCQFFDIRRCVGCVIPFPFSAATPLASNVGQPVQDEGRFHAVGPHSTQSTPRIHPACSSPVRASDSHSLPACVATWPATRCTSRIRASTSDCSTALRITNNCTVHRLAQQ